VLAIDENDRLFHFAHPITAPPLIYYARYRDLKTSAGEPSVRRRSRRVVFPIPHVGLSPSGQASVGCACREAGTRPDFPVAIAVSIPPQADQLVERAVADEQRGYLREERAGRK
jgi:hypothetical protein